MVQTRLIDLLNLIDETIEEEHYPRALQLILQNWYDLPDPSPLRERTALLLASVGRKREAVEVYSLAARHYANSGFPTRALASIKQMQNLNPSSTQLLDHFTTLYSVRSPFLERNRTKTDFPFPSGRLNLDADNTGDEEELFKKALEQALDKEGTAERPGVLPALPLLSILPPKALRRLLDFLDYEIFAEVQPVIDAEKKQSDLFWTVSSDLMIGNADEPFRIPAGALLGLSSFGQDAKPPKYSVISQKGSECLRLNSRSVQALSEEFPDFPNRLATLRRHAFTEGIFVRHPMFNDLEEEALEKLPSRMVGLKIDAGTICIRQGKTSPGLFIILDGKLDIVRTDDDWEITVDVLGSGDMVGEVGLVKPRPSLVTAVTTKPCHALFFARSDFMAFADHYPSIAAYAEKLATIRVAAIEDTISATDLAEVD